MLVMEAAFGISGVVDADLFTHTSKPSCRTEGWFDDRYVAGAGGGLR
jgi:hypothetical protein